MMKWPLEVGIAEFRMWASLLRKSTFLLNRETNSHALQGLKKKVELPQNKQIFSSVSGSLERIKQGFLYWSRLRTFVLTSASVPIYAAGFYTSTSGGHSNFRLLTKYLQKRRSEHPNPSVREGKHRDLNLFPNYCSVLEAKTSQKLEREIPQRERGWESFPMVWTCLWREWLFLWDETRRWERLYVEPLWRFPCRRSLQFSDGPWGGGFGRQLNFQANCLPE